MRAACADISKNGMGTTLTCLMCCCARTSSSVRSAIAARHPVAQGRLTQITHDQSLVNQLLESGQITPEQAGAL